jgi:hypothetical protein
VEGGEAIEMLREKSGTKVLERGKEMKEER